MAKELAVLLQTEIDALNEESTKHKRQFRLCQTLVISLSALSSIVSAWALTQPAPPKFANLAIVVITALATAISAWIEMKRSRDLWQHERPLYHSLKDLKRELEFCESIGELTAEKKREIFQRMSQILSQSGTRWVKLTKDQGTPGEKDGERDDDDEAPAGPVSTGRG